MDLVSIVLLLIAILDTSTIVLNFLRMAKKWNAPTLILFLVILMPLFQLGVSIWALFTIGNWLTWVGLFASAINVARTFKIVPNGNLVDVTYVVAKFYMWYVFAVALMR